MSLPLWIKIPFRNRSIRWKKSLSNAAALKQNESSQNQRALERAKEDQKNQLTQANDSINSAEAAYIAAQNTVNSLNSQIKSISDQVNATSDEDTKAALQEKLSDLQDQLSGAKSDLTSADSARKEAKKQLCERKIHPLMMRFTLPRAALSLQNTIRLMTAIRRHSWIS